MFVSIILIWKDVVFSKSEGLWEKQFAYVELFYSHCIMLFFSFLTLYGVYWTSKRRKSTEFRQNLTYIFCSVVLMWCAFLCGWITQQVNGQITEYIIAIIGIASTIYISPIWSATLFVGSELIFLFLLFTISDSPNSNGHITNTLIITTLAIVIARIGYTSKFNEIKGSETIKRQNELIKKSNEDLERKNFELSELIQEKNEFLGIVSHDLKNPISAILLSVESLIRYSDVLDKQAKDTMKTNIVLMAKRMKDIVSNLLEVNALESGSMKPNFKECAIVPIIRHSINLYKSQIEQKQIELESTFSNENATLMTDESFIGEIIDNLLSNAVKYCRKNGKVSIKLTQDDKFLLLTFYNEGEGISEDDRKHLYKKFRKLNARPTNNEDSTGLGLSIVKKLTEMLDGRIACTSQPGQWVQFTVEFPR